MKINNQIRPVIAIIPTTALSFKMHHELEEWFQREFGLIPLQWDKPCWYALARYENSLIGRIGIVKRKIRVGNSTIWVGGISGVATSPEWRKQGVASMLLRKTADFLAEVLNTEFGLLVCRDEMAPFYMKNGWEKIEAYTYFMQESGRYRYKQTSMTLRCKERNWPRGDVDLCGLPW
jgi:GNAT superfamily N-acetyltransferase